MVSNEFGKNISHDVKVRRKEFLMTIPLYFFLDGGTIRNITSKFILSKKVLPVLPFLPVLPSEQFTPKFSGQGKVFRRLLN
ncbi:MAG: hypothetical protein ATN31_08125 [Candidatus Epulonipiscioides saccharophilum]|nr:MAG: hypothetical protein ATN31_08125 [Epulopiscium sp. AS2M-Bin001]